MPDRYPALQEADFIPACKRVGSEFQIKSLTVDIRPPPKYVVLHVRGNNKPAVSTDFITVELLRQMPQNIPAIVMTDDEKLTDAILQDASLAKNVVRLPKQATKYESMMQDFNMLLGATAIIQHSPHAWSSFSSVPAMMRGIPLLSTFISEKDERRSHYVGTLAGFDRTAAVPKELNCGNRREVVSRFMSKLSKKASLSMIFTDCDECQDVTHAPSALPGAASATAEELVRFLLVLGSEGSGHSYMSTVWNNSTSREVLEAVEGGLDEHKDLMHSLYNNLGQAGLYDWPCKPDGSRPEAVFSSAVTHLQAMRDKVLLGLKSWRQQFPLALSEAVEVVIPLNSVDDVSTGMGSYPNFLGPCRALQYPDVDAPFDACTTAGVSCSFLVLLRDPKEMIYSTRGVQEIHSQIKLMSSMLSVIHTQAEIHLDAPHWCMEHGAPDNTLLPARSAWTRHTSPPSSPTPSLSPSSRPRNARSSPRTPPASSSRPWSTRTGASSSSVRNDDTAFTRVNCTRQSSPPLTPLRERELSRTRSHPSMVTGSTDCQTIAFRSPLRRDVPTASMQWEQRSWFISLSLAFCGSSSTHVSVLGLHKMG